jgi:hypothetical protein
MGRHTIPVSFAGLTALFQEIFSRLESIERRPRPGTERITITTDATLDPVTRYVWVDTASNIDVTLPDAWDGSTITFKNLQAITATIIPVSGTIDGLSTASVFGLNTIKTFQSDGTNWISI